MESMLMLISDNLIESSMTNYVYIHIYIYVYICILSYIVYITDFRLQKACIHGLKTIKNKCIIYRAMENYVNVNQWQPYRIMCVNICTFICAFKYRYVYVCVHAYMIYTCCILTYTYT
jgi:hypothetical protein